MSQPSSTLSTDGAPHSSAGLDDVRRGTGASPVRILGIRFWPQAAAFTLLAAAVRLVVLLRSPGMVDGDEAVLGIQAERILGGAHPIYFAGQTYMGSWDAYLAAPLIALFGPSGWALHAVTLIESLALVPLMGALAERLYGRRARMAAMLFTALPPLYVTIGELRALGGYVETLVLGTALLLVATHIAERWQQRRATGPLWLLAGLLTGLGAWIDPLIIYYVVASALWLAPLALARAWRGGPRDAAWWRGTLAGGGGALGAAALGAAPAILYGLQHQFDNFTTYAAPPNALAASHPLRLGVARYLLTIALPRVIGAQSLWVMALWAQWLDLALGVAAALLAVLALGWGISRLLPLRSTHPRDWLDLDAPLLRKGWRAALAPLLVLVVCLIFWRSSATGEATLFVYMDAAGRYALPITTALTLLLAGLIADLPTLMTRLRRPASAGHAPPPATTARRQHQAVLALLAALLLAYTVPYTTANGVLAMQSPYRPYLTFPAEHADLLTYLKRHNIHAVWATHWIGNVVMYLEDQRVLSSDYVDISVWHGKDRFPQVTQAVARADRASFIVEADPAHGKPALAVALDTLHVTYESAHFGSIWVITPLSRTVNPDEVQAALLVGA